MSGVDVDVVSEEPEADDVRAEEAPSGGESKRRRSHVEVEIEREITRRRLIESVTSIVVVVLYMIFTLMRERDAGVVVLDDQGPEDDWVE